MVRFTIRLSFALLIVLQPVGPALAEGWTEAKESCGCGSEPLQSETQWSESSCCESMCCETVITECEGCGASEIADSEMIDEAACGCESAATPTASNLAKPADTKSTEPVTAETKKTEAPVATKPAEALPQTGIPVIEKADELPPAPIAVPQDTPPAPTNTNELFPGPAAQPPAEQTPSAETPAAEQPVDSNTNTEGLFGEPVAPVEESANDPAPEATETEVTETTEELFVEPAQDAAGDTETPPATEQAPPADTQEEAPAAGNPLDELFGPSEQASDPATATDDKPKEDKPADQKSEEAEVFDPFGQNEMPSLPLTNSELRPWSDPVAGIRCEARLVSMTTVGVRVATPSGEVVDMSFTELSDADLNFVRASVRAQRTLLAPPQFAATSSIQ